MTTKTPAEREAVQNKLAVEGGAGGVGAGMATKTPTEWEAVQKVLDEERRRRAEARKLAVEGGTGGERSLYDILQANKGMCDLFVCSFTYSFIIPHPRTIFSSGGLLTFWPFLGRFLELAG